MQEEKVSGNKTIYALVWCHDDPGHGTRNARGDPLKVYINTYVYILTSKSVLQSSTELARVGYIYIYIYIYSVLCTSCCVVFLYNVPPLTGQVLGKVLLTSWENKLNYWWFVNKQFIEVPRSLTYNSYHRATWSCDEDSHKYHRFL